jgi:hypothetical protein
VIQIQGLDAASPQPPDVAAEELELRQRAARSLEAALGFIEDYGDGLAVSRAHVTLEVIAPAECVEALAGLQTDDGSFQPFGGVFSGAIVGELRGALLPPELLGTLEALSVLADLRALSSGCAERSIEFLTRVQRSDGSWGHADPIADAAAPEEAQQAAVSERLFATGMFAGFAARSPYARPELLAWALLAWAARFLAKLWSPELLSSELLPSERAEGGRWSALAAYAHFYANGGDPERADEALQWCGRELEKGFRGGRFEANDTLRVLLYCDAHALPGSSFDTRELLARLLDEQAEDGGFAALDPGGPPGRVAPTLDALMSLRGLCQGL